LVFSDFHHGSPSGYQKEERVAMRCVQEELFKF